MQQVRCSWAESNELFIPYHDEEWGVPVHDDRLLFEMLNLEGAQAGLSWLTILKKRESYRKAFDYFDAEKIVLYDTAKKEALLQNEGIIRSRAKIEATIKGAQIYLAMKKDGEDFSKWVWEMAGGKPILNHGPLPAKSPLSEEISAALRKRGFKFVGPVIVYAWMQAIGIVNDHSPECFRRKAVSKG